MRTYVQIVSSVSLLTFAFSPDLFACDYSEPGYEYVEMLTSRSSGTGPGYLSCQSEINQFNVSCQRSPVTSARLDSKVRRLRRKLASSSGKKHLLIKSQLYVLERNETRRMKKLCQSYIERIDKSCRPVMKKYKEYLNTRNDLSCISETDREIMGQMQSLQSSFYDNRSHAISFVNQMNRLSYKYHKQAYYLQQRASTVIASHPAR